MFSKILKLTVAGLLLASTTALAAADVDGTDAEKADKVSTPGADGKSKDAREGKTGTDTSKNAEETQKAVDAALRANGASGAALESGKHVDASVEAARARAKEKASSTSTTVADAHAQELSRLHTELQLLIKDRNAEAAGVNEQFVKNIDTIGKWNPKNGFKAESAVELLLKLHGNQIAHLDPAGQKAAKGLMNAIVSEIYASGFADADEVATEAISDAVATYVLSVKGELKVMTKSQKEDYYKAAKNDIEIINRTADRIKAERSANGGRFLTNARKAEIKKQVIVELIKEHHNLNPNDPNDPTKMSDDDIVALADQIMKEGC